MKAWRERVHYLADTLEGSSISASSSPTLPSCFCKKFLHSWKPTDLVLSSERAMQSRIQKDLLLVHKKKYTEELVPVVYRPIDTRMQKRRIRIPATNEVLKNAVSHDRAWVPLSVVEEVIKDINWRLGYGITVHTSQGLTIKDKLWIIDYHLCWSNLIYTAVSRVEYMHQLQRAIGPELRYDNTPIDVAKNNIKLLSF